MLLKSIKGMLACTLTKAGVSQYLLSKIPLMKKVTARQVLLTPANAVVLLDNQHPNRRIIERQVEYLVDAIMHDRFSPFLYPLLLDEDERLITGQHLCEAVIRCGRSVPVGVISGVPHDEVSYCEGTGVKQSLTHLLVRDGKLQGKSEKVIRSMASILKVLMIPNTRWRPNPSDIRKFTNCFKNSFNFNVLETTAKLFKTKPHHHWIGSATVQAAFARLYWHMKPSDWEGAIRVYRGQVPVPTHYQIYADLRDAVERYQGSVSDAADRFYFYGTLQCESLRRTHKHLRQWNNTTYTPALASTLDTAFPWPAQHKCGVIV